MKQPWGFIDSRFPHHVCKLHHSLYGLKQVPCAWFHRLSEFLIKLGFWSSQADHLLFVLQDGPLKFYVIVYVDDIHVTCLDTGKL